MEAIVLAGGMGTRLRSVVWDRPKPLAEVAGVPFLALKLAQLEQLGVRRAILSVGYLGEMIVRAIGERAGRIEIDYVVEAQPLGTGGASRLAMQAVRSEVVLLTNGDSFCDVPIDAMHEALRRRRARMAMALAQVEDAARYGTVVLADDGTVTGFAEKGAAGPALINAGVYLLRRDVLSAQPPDKAFSLEKDVFPLLVAERACVGCPGAGRFIDIGVPDDLRAAQDLLAPIARELSGEARASAVGGKDRE